ncbi:hypothetical protein FHR83_009311 [Actinoplanes campanulatus]|uniref:Uncharacterized protein n=1 Tax=Actinoplanes campanulatus TaxID=113559 RepID=A0A7W5ASF8_9ACTN|nr:hypothetical protein [Actinoplanes campanulatus]MBB3101582.1 hypothetical protein [Actinoplanes campanulatus]
MRRAAGKSSARDVHDPSCRTIFDTKGNDSVTTINGNSGNGYGRPAQHPQRRPQFHGIRGTRTPSGT